MSDKLREIVATINNCCNNRLSIVDNTVATIFVIDHPAVEGQSRECGVDIMGRILVVLDVKCVGRIDMLK